VVVWRSRLDSAIRRCSSRRLEHLEDQVLTALRIGAAQILVLGIPAHAAVSTSAACVTGRGATGYVNAVLRRLASTGEAADDPPWVRFSHPETLFRRWSARFGEDHAIRLMEWDNEIPPLGGWPGPGASGEGTPGRWLSGYRVYERSGPMEPDRIPDGAYIQDEGAAIVGEGAARLPGSRMVEVGASPGGKTAHLDAGAAVLAAVDISRARIGRWLENRSRLGWSRSLAVVADGTALPFSACDKVVIDAPCTSTGVLRRRPDARWRWSASRLEECVAVQRRLISAGAGALAPGGILVYSVCSLEPEECTGQVSWFEESSPGFRRLDFPAPSVLVSEGVLDIFPPDRLIDGHFAVAWIREI